MYLAEAESVLFKEFIPPSASVGLDLVESASVWLSVVCILKFDSGGVGGTKKVGVRGVVRISVLLSVLAFTGDVVSILDEPEARLGLSRIELLGVEVTFTDILSRIDDETEMFELTVFERDGALGVTVGGLGGVSLHLATSVRKRATS